MKSSRLKKKYKALIVDVDNTLVSNSRNALPSNKVSAAVAKASKKIHVGIATSRCLYVAREIVDHLELSGPSILNGGGQVIDFPSKKESYAQPIGKKDVQKIVSVFKSLNFPFIICDGESKDKQFNGKIPKRSFMIFCQGLEEKIANKMLSLLSENPNISVFTTRSWTVGKLDVLVTHPKATKQHGVLEIAKILNISTDDIIAVGDGYNDFPLLMACGLKIAMGNAVDDLKEIADYVAPSVDEDGVADVIERFVL